MGLLIRRLVFAVGSVLVAAGFAGLINDAPAWSSAIFVFVGAYLIAVAVLRRPTSRR